MYGAMLGDIIGSPYEVYGNNKTKDFPLFSEKSCFTDDTVMTFAVCNGLLAEDFQGNEESIKASLVKACQAWGRQYSNAGYGRNFFFWLFDENPVPYGSYGNGSAMRVASAGWLYETLEETRHIARLTAEISHNHPEGIKGAESVASAIWLARTGKSKEEIKQYITDEFGYDLSMSCDDIRPNYHHDESCQNSVPQAIVCFLESTGFEDAIRNAVSLGGDADTQGAIAGSIAEAFYGIPDELMEKCQEYMTANMKKVAEYFDGVKLHRKDR